MKLTQAKKVGEIVRPPLEGMPIAFSVAITDPIMRAIELMLKNGVTQIAVVGRCGLIGRVMLEDALQYLGLRSNPPSGAPRGFGYADADQPEYPKG